MVEASCVEDKSFCQSTPILLMIMPSLLYASKIMGSEKMKLSFCKKFPGTSSETITLSVEPLLIISSQLLCDFPVQFEPLQALM
jgi:hypothetical protein